MKRYTIFIALIFCVNGLFAQHVTEKQALQKAQAFMQGKLKNSTNGRRGASANAPAMQRVTQTAQTDAYYIFNAEQNGGFVIVSGDDRTPEILGYSLSGSFDTDNMPPAMEALLNHYSEEIRQIQEGSAVAAARRASHPSVAQMMTVKWGQDDPYNQKTMTGYYTNGNSFQCVTGCVATAMAQVLYHQHFVDKTQAEIPGYQNPLIYKEGTGYMNAVPAGTALDWANMVDSYNGSETQTQKNAVASLMMYCGVAVHMRYTYQESSASMSDIPEAFKTYFGYSRGTRYVTRSSYSADDWDNLIYNEIASGRPVIYSGIKQNGGGHAFILHGYDGNGRYAINWGWAGYQDNYFMLDDLTPPSQGTSGGYNYDQEAVIYLTKEDGTFKEDVIATVSGIAIGDMVFDSQNYLVIPTGQSYQASRNYTGGVSFALSLTYSSDLANTYYFDLGYGIQNAEGNLIGDVDMLSYKWELKQGLWRMTATGTSNFASGWSEGTYYIKAYCRENGTQDWSVCKDADKFAIKMVVSSSTIKFEVVDISTPDPEPQPEPVVTVTLNKSEAILEKTKTMTLKATVYPETLTDKSVTWKSSNTAVATVSSSGKVKGVKAGTATITCTSNATGAKATCKVTVGYVKLDKTEAILEKTKTMTLKATVYPSALEDRSVTWKSSDTKIATVSSSGKVKGVKAGTATITCTSNATGLSTTCTVTVGYVKLDKTEAILEKYKTMTLTATVYPSKLEDRSVTWESSDTKIATVTSSGEVEGVKAGTAVITCTSNATGLSTTCTVTVGYVKLDKTEAILEKTKTMTLTATVYPSKLEDRSVTWKSSDTKIATVSSSGKVKGVKAGFVTITCTSNATGLSTTCKVTVGYVKLDKTEAILEKTKTMTLTPTVYPSKLEDRSVTWKSSDTKIATVSSTGKVKGVKAGFVTITCTSNATGLSTACQVTVGYVKLDQTEVTVQKDQAVTLTPTVYPSKLEDRSVTWKSSDTKIATVSSSGKVKGVNAGTVTITCTSNATGLSTTCKVTVTGSSNARSLEDDADVVTGIEHLEESPAAEEPFDVYDLRGHRVRQRVTSLDGLPAGVYIVNGKKVMKK